jgi:outer membrane protein assembly factor BamB
VFDGSAVDGFPLVLEEKVQIGVALADFNGNGRDDIVVGTDGFSLHLFYDDGTEAPGFPYQVGSVIRSAPAILDVGGQKVIFVGSHDNNMYAINADGSLRFSILTTDLVQNSPAFLEYNNTFYVFFSDDNGIIYAVDTNGNALSGWPVDAGAAISKSVAFSDLDGDGSAEVVAVAAAGDVLAYNLDGTMHSGFPLSSGAPGLSSPMILDMDGDGDLEILVGSNASLVALDIKTAGSSDDYWSMYRGSALRAGYSGVLSQPGCMDATVNDGSCECAEGYTLINGECYYAPNNHSLNGACIVVQPHDPPVYIIFNGEGLITGLGGYFMPDTAGWYSVDSDGELFAGSIGDVNTNFPFTGQILNDTTANLNIVFEDTLAGQMIKIMDEGACRGNWSGTFSDDVTNINHEVNMEIDGSGLIVSGMTSVFDDESLSGRFFYETPYLVGHLSFGEANHEVGGIMWQSSQIGIEGGSLFGNTMEGSYGAEAVNINGGTFSLIRETVSGCTQPEACNYDVSAMHVPSQFK